MYRCTECKTEYTKCPDFCDCGNDTFEEVFEEEYEERYVKPKIKSKKTRLSQEELEEIEEERIDKRNALIAISTSLFICILILCFAPPHMQKKADVVKKVSSSVTNVKFPDVNAYWDNTVASPYRKEDPTLNLPILNKNLGRISPVLREYLINVGAEFNRLWDVKLVDGQGECKVEFVINKEGNLSSKKIVVRSHNESLDDSVLLLLSKLNSFDIPTDDYKGERIIISFKVDKNKTNKVYYPMN